MSNPPKFSVAFNIAGGDDQRYAAFELYRRAFGAIKITEEVQPGVGVYISMEMYGIRVLLAPGGDRNRERVVTCEFLYDNEKDLRRAYEVLTEEAEECSIGSYPWAPVGALVTDKFGVGWWLRT